MSRALTISIMTTLLISSTALAQSLAPSTTGCGVSDTIVVKIQKALLPVTHLADANGGIFKPNRMWSAIVDRNGNLCSVINTNGSNGDAWPGSREIAIAKAETANDFSNSALALSTANLYAPTQPGGSLYGLNNSNPFNPEFREGRPPVRNPGGIITFGGGVALYSNGAVIGGLGVSGDTSCADHAIAYRMRRRAGFDGIPNGVGPGGTDNISYAPTGHAPTGFQQPHCGASDITP